MRAPVLGVHLTHAGGDDVVAVAHRVPRRRPWVLRRLSVIVASAGLIVAGMIISTGGAHLIGHAAWGLPNDLWATLVAAERLWRGDLAHLYTQPQAHDNAGRR